MVFLQSVGIKQKPKTFDEILASNPDTWEEDTLSMAIAEDIASEEIVEEFEEMDRSVPQIGLIWHIKSSVVNPDFLNLLPVFFYE